MCSFYRTCTVPQFSFHVYNIFKKLQAFITGLAIVLSMFILSYSFLGPRWLNELGSWITLQLVQLTSLSPIRRGFVPSFVNYKKGCTGLAAASDKVYQLLAHGQWFSLGTPASSTTKTGRYDIAEILLKVALNTKIQIHIPIMKKERVGITILTGLS